MNEKLIIKELRERIKELEQALYEAEFARDSYLALLDHKQNNTATLAAKVES